MRLWLDDRRKPPWGYDLWAKTADEAIAMLELLPEGTPDMKKLSPGELHTAYAKVGWSEIARDFNEMKG